MTMSKTRPLLYDQPEIAVLRPFPDFCLSEVSRESETESELAVCRRDRVVFQNQMIRQSVFLLFDLPVSHNRDYLLVQSDRRFTTRENYVIVNGLLVNTEQQAESWECGH